MREEGKEERVEEKEEGKEKKVEEKTERKRRGKRRSRRGSWKGPGKRRVQKGLECCGSPQSQLAQHHHSEDSHSNDSGHLPQQSERNLPPSFSQLLFLVPPVVS